MEQFTFSEFKAEKVKLLMIDLTINIIVDYFKKTVRDLLTITTNIQGGNL